MEHFRHFGLADDPFRNEPQPGAYLQTREHGDALLRLERGARQAKGFSLLIGASGSGKTMVVRQLFDKLEEEVFEASMLVVLSETADADWTLRRYASQLGVEDPAPDREKLYAQVYERLAIVREDGRHAVLLIDDAQALASTRALGELVTLLKLEYEDRRLVSLILAGDESLEASVGANPALADRVDIVVHLSGLDAEATAEYMAHRMALCAGDPTVIEPAALAAIHARARGLPGRMNTLADNAFFEAYRAKRSRLTCADVERACAELRLVFDAGAAAEPQVERSAQRPGPPRFASIEGKAQPAARPLVALEEVQSDLDAEFEAVFESATLLEDEPAGTHEIPVYGPPKDADDEVEDLLVEILED